jgi:8-oxo-dGTP diphosphatase
MGVWNGVGGKIDAEETPEQCVIREVLEETGITLKDIRDAGRITWITPRETSGMIVYIANVPVDFQYATPRVVDEGILDWKAISWVLHADNRGISHKVNEFLPLMLDSADCYDHQFTYDANDITLDYTKILLK